MNHRHFATWCLEKNKAVDVQYDLYGVIVHVGSELHCGHYVSYVKHKEQWLCLNDNEVTMVSADAVLQQKAYLLFYSNGSKANNQQSSGLSRV